MTKSWGMWRAFPNPQLGENIEAPIGPGVYEVRHVLTGELVSFGHTTNVARALLALLPQPTLLSWLTRLMRPAVPYPIVDLEYRTCPARSADEARTIAVRLTGRREVYMKRRAAVSLA